MTSFPAQADEFLRTALNKSVQLLLAGNPAAAEPELKAVLCLSPAQIDANHLLGVACQQTGRVELAVHLIRRASWLNPAIADVHHNLGHALMLVGRTDEAVLAFDAAITANPGHFVARFCRVGARLPLVYSTPDDIERSRTAYAGDLAALADEVAAAPPQLRAAMSAAVPNLRPFFLAYQGCNDRDLQAVFGRICCDLMAARHPEAARALPVPPADADGRLRVGFLSGFFSNHSNWKIRIRSWLERLDRRRFRLYGYYTRNRRDADTMLAERLCDRFVQGPLSVDQWVTRIQADAPHVLIIPEISMDETVLALSALRLAPVQATSWGHPNTSGLPTIDYFLTSDRMEIPGAEAHYTETLVRLPNLSFYYMPRRPKPVDIRRSDIGVPDDAPMFWCCQSFAKYLPQDDHLLARIARRLPGARFVFIRSYLGPGIDRVLQERLAAAFAAEGVSAADACIFLPLQDYDRFNAIAALADAALDTPAWSGCNTTLETLAHGVPVVTLPGQFMRGRHSLAILEMIGVTETIAGDEDAYVDIACRLITDPAWRRAVSGHIAASIHRAYEDMDAILGLEHFIEGAVAHAARHGTTPADVEGGDVTRG